MKRANKVDLKYIDKKSRERDSVKVILCIWTCQGCARRSFKMSKFYICGKDVCFSVIHAYFI